MKTYVCLLLTLVVSQISCEDQYLAIAQFSAELCDVIKHGDIAKCLKAVQDLFCPLQSEPDSCYEALGHVRGVIAENPADKQKQQANRYGDYGMGGFGMGDYGMGNFGMGDYGMGNFGMGDYGMGNHGMGNYGMGNHGMGNYGMGNGYYGWG